MINQYLVLHEIGHGTHGRVRLGRDMSVDIPPEELEADLATGSGPFYAIKIVERNPKTKRLAGLGRQRALARTGGASGAKLVAENEWVAHADRELTCAGSGRRSPSRRSSTTPTSCA